MPLMRSGIEPDWLASSLAPFGSSATTRLSALDASLRRLAAAFGLRCVLRSLLTMSPRVGTLLRLAEPSGATALESGYCARTAGPGELKPETASPVPVSARSNPAARHSVIPSEEIREATCCGKWTWSLLS